MPPRRCSFPSATSAWVAATSCDPGSNFSAHSIALSVHQVSDRRFLSPDNGTGAQAVPACYCWTPGRKSDPPLPFYSQIAPTPVVTRLNGEMTACSGLPPKTSFHLQITEHFSIDSLTDHGVRPHAPSGMAAMPLRQSSYWHHIQIRRCGDVVA